MKITKVCTQGRQDAGQWVTSFYLSSSVDNVHWSIYRFRSGNKVRNIPCRYFIVRKKNIYQNTSFKERFFASLYYCYKTENGEKMLTSTIALLSTSSGDETSNRLGLCDMYYLFYRPYYQRLTVESWVTNFEPTLPNRIQQLLVRYKRFIGGI